MAAFKMNYKQRPGERGAPHKWRANFRTRLGMDAARATMADDSPHGILGVPLSATWAEIKTAYRKLAREHHPDLGGNPANFRKMQAAYEILEDRYQ